MSESIVIQENGVAKTLTVDKLNTKLAESGTCDWVPEDGFKVGTLKVWRNGTFKASDFGVYGFDKVIVVSGSRGGNAAKLQGDKHPGEIHPEALAIKEGGKAVKLYDVHHISVNKTDSSRLSMMSEPLLIVDDLTATKKGTYTAYDYGKYGFDEVTVNIPYDAGGGGNTPPDEIRVTKPPNITEYLNGATINPAGMVVTAYKNGAVWKNSEYPNGQIPLNELNISPEIVDFAEIQGGFLEEFYLPNATTLHDNTTRKYGFESNANIVYGFWYYSEDDNKFNSFTISETSYKEEGYCDGYGWINNQARNAGFYYYIDHSVNTDKAGYLPLDPIPFTHEKYLEIVQKLQALASAMVIDPAISVSWERPIDGQLLKTVFAIKIVSSEGASGGGAG